MTVITGMTIHSSVMDIACHMIIEASRLAVRHPREGGDPVKINWRF